MERLGSSSALTAAVLKGITSSYEKTRNIASKLLVVTLLVFSNHVSAQEDILDFMPAIIAAATAANSCSDGVYATCTNSVGCRRIDGVFENGQCSAKPLGRSLAEQFAGTWSAQTNFDNGLFHNLLTFDVGTLAKVPSSPDYVIKGTSYSSNVSSGNFRFPTAVSHDSRNDDWFILDFWGTDIGLASSIEITRTSENQFDGCEFVIEFPDMTYRDGICNPIRLRRVGEAPSTIRVIQNFVSDIGSYVADLFGITQTGPRPSTVDTARPTVANIAGLPTSAMQITSPLAITSPENRALINGISSQIQGTVEQDINFNGLTVNGRNVAVDGGAFDANIGVEEGRNTVIVEADFGRRTFSAELTLEVDNEPPLLIVAASTSSSSVVVQFSEAMIDSLVDDVANFNITRNDNSANLPITSIEFVNDSHTSVRLFTGLQNNVGYTLRAVNTRDAAGNVISGPISETDISVTTAEFVGTRPTGDEILDTDDDGIFDHVELTGYQVIVRRTDGSSEIIQVTSDPFSDDADNDGVSDAEERHAGTDPLNRDTDGDTLSDGDEWNRIYSNPVDQDTDRDGIQDGFEFLFFKTSPILADTDGDQIDDPTELAAGNRSPLVADIPSPSISVGNVNLQLKTTYQITNSEGQVRTTDRTSETNLSQSENDTFANANETSNSNTLSNSRSLSRTVSSSFSGGVSEGKPKAVLDVSASVTEASANSESSSRGSTVAVSEESSQASERAYNESLSAGTEISVDETVARNVDAGAIRVDVSIDNASDIPFSISNLELTALTQDPNNRRRLIPIGSLSPQSGIDNINIGAIGDTARGPFVFTTGLDDVFPGEVEELMKNPRGLIIQLANFDIVDQQGNNFAFTSQEVLDRTVGISFDLGDGRTETYRVATASDHDENTGLPSGITMRQALETAGLITQRVIQDGGNGLIETAVAGGSDDVLVTDRPIIEPRSTIILPGDNGVLDTTVVGGDDIIVEPDYETRLISYGPSIADGGNGIIETAFNDDDDVVLVDAALTEVEPNAVLVRSGDDDSLESVPLPNGDDVIIPAPKPTRLLTRFRDAQANSLTTQFWVMYTSENVEGVDLDDIIVRSGQQYNFTFIQDQDDDGVWAREEYLHGSSDLNRNTDGCTQAQVDLGEQCETLSDQFEIQQGWRVQLRNSPQSSRVYSSPSEADSDLDGLFDDVEHACELDPRQQDTDLDGLTDFEELLGRRISADGSSGQLVSDSSLGLGTIFITPYKDLNADIPSRVRHTSLPECDAILQERYGTNGTAPITFGFVEGFATDPLSADTDGDFIPDLREIELGIDPNFAGDGAAFLDDDNDGLSNRDEIEGIDIIVNGQVVRVTSEVNIADSDGDGLPDLLERFLMSNPRSGDTDGDDISDSNEYAANGANIVTQSVGVLGVRLNAITNPEFNFIAYQARCNEAQNCDQAQIDANVGANGFGRRGTNLSERDTDFDRLNDFEEVVSDLVYSLDGGTATLPAGTLDPLNRDTDGDELFDGDEIKTGYNIVIPGSFPEATFNVKTNPNSADTDGDGTNDKVEVTQARTFNFLDDADNSNNSRNPTVADRWLEVVTNDYRRNTNNQSNIGARQTGFFRRSGQQTPIRSFQTEFNFYQGATNVPLLIDGSPINETFFKGVIRQGEGAITIIASGENNVEPVTDCTSPQSATFDYDTSAGIIDFPGVYFCGNGNFSADPKALLRILP